MRIKTRLFCKLSSETLNLTVVSGSRHRFPKSAHLVYCGLLQMLNLDTRTVVYDFLKEEQENSPQGYFLLCIFDGLNYMYLNS